MIIGAHSIIYSSNHEADLAFMRDVLQLPNVDAGDGFLIFGLPPSEMAVHEAESNGKHELYLMCNDVEAFTVSMASRGIDCTPVENQGWGLLTQLTLPGGSSIGVYQPQHPRPEPIGLASEAKKPASRAAKKRPKKAAKKKAAKQAAKPKPKAKGKAKAKATKRR